MQGLLFIVLFIAHQTKAGNFGEKHLSIYGCLYKDFCFLPHFPSFWENEDAQAAKLCGMQYTVEYTVSLISGQHASTILGIELGMKTGKVAKVFGIDRKTVSNWTDMPPLKKFFTPEALGIDRTQREYLEPDILIINTIRVMRNRGDDWDQIAAALERGERERELPASAMLVETTAPIAQYGRIVELQTALEAAEEQIEHLYDEIQRLQEEMAEQDKAHQTDVERLLREAADREGKLQREIGKLEATIEMTKQRRDGA